jgi:hypothetical protein
MAVLQQADRNDVCAGFQRDISTAREPLTGLTKSQLQAAVDAADQWVSDNAASYNSALPVAARTAMTAAQKSRILRDVLHKRYDKGV